MTRKRITRRGWLVLVCSLVAVGANAADHPLVDAVKAQDAEAVRALLDDGADVNAPQPDGATALHWAAYRDDVETAGLLLAAGANVTAANELGATPLWLAASNGSSAMVERLLDAGAEPNVALPGGETPVMSAARTGSAGAVRALAERGANVNVAEQSRGQTALMWAVAEGHHDTIRVLIEQGADVNARSRVRRRLMHADSTNASQYDQGIMWNRGGYTPLLFAARQGDVEAAKLLVAAGADINEAAPTGASVLVVATHSGQTDFASYVIEAGADVNDAGAGYNALHAAILRGDLEIVRAVLASGIDPNARLEKGTPLRRTSQDWYFNPSLESATPFWLAAYFREPEIMRALVDAGADPTLTTLELWRRVFERAGGVGPPHVAGGFQSPLLAAVRGDSTRGRFFNTSLRDVDGEERLALEAVKLAVEFGTDINAVDYAGTAALHAAAQRNFTTIVRYLAESGADLNVKTKSGRTPLQLAIGASRSRRFLVEEGRYPSGNTVDILRELGAEEPEAAPERR
ncbi:MAG: ankyrin repeat domain-containing protein [Vicinamibacterales bacterium]|jgi:ankyrin repeat protein|nr:ankyrin repeat domain-containing protein [Vicinamibacterales bacterium]